MSFIPSVSHNFTVHIEKNMDTTLLDWDMTVRDNWYDKHAHSRPGQSWHYKVSRTKPHWKRRFKRK